MSNLIKEYQTFSESDSNDSYPYVFEFIGEKGKYLMRVAEDNESFIVEFPNGDISLSSANLIKLAKPENSFFGQFENGTLLTFLQLQFEKDASRSVEFEYVDDDRFYMLKLAPSKDLGTIIFPDTKRVWFRISAPDKLESILQEESSNLYEWIVKRINETSFYYSALCEGKVNEAYNEECQRIGNRGIITSRIEMTEGEYYQIVCDKDRDVIVVYFPARCIPTTSERFFEDVDGLIGTHKGKIESFFLDKLREAKFNMKPILNSRDKAMEIIDAWRQKKA
jgi:hypothetical protein